MQRLKAQYTDRCMYISSIEEYQECQDKDDISYILLRITNRLISPFHSFVAKLFH